MTEKPSEKQIEARNSLLKEQRPIFDELVSDYKYAATTRHGRPYVSYVVLADLIKVGWRPSAESVHDKEDQGT